MKVSSERTNPSDDPAVTLTARPPADYRAAYLRACDLLRALLTRYEVGMPLDPATKRLLEEVRRWLAS